MSDNDSFDVYDNTETDLENKQARRFIYVRYTKQYDG